MIPCGMKYDTVLFDLDGTLTDPYLGIANSIKYALDKFNISDANDDKLKLCIGPPLDKSFMEYYGFNAADAKRAVAYFREYYSVKGMYENKIYDGIENMLKTLADKNINCIVATSKLEKYAAAVLKYFNIDVYFRDLTGSNQEGTLSEKKDIIKHILDKHKPEKEKTVMVGDRKYDIIGAKSNGIDSIWVLYGYGTREELEEIKPTKYCKRVEELVKLL
jgi:phosphoglycolate phosphatase